MYVVNFKEIDVKEQQCTRLNCKIQTRLRENDHSSIYPCACVIISKLLFSYVATPPPLPGYRADSVEKKSKLSVVRLQRLPRTVRAHNRTIVPG